MKRGSNQVDTPQMIKLCLNCPWPVCWNCLGLKNKYSYGLRLELSEGRKTVGCETLAQ